MSVPIPAADATKVIGPEPGSNARGLGAQAFRSGWISLVAQFAQLALRLGSTIVLARLLSREAYGLVAMVTVVTGFIALFKSLGLASATVQAPQITHAQLNGVFWVNVAVGVIAMALTVAVAPLLAWFYGEPQLTFLAIGLSVTFLFGGLAVQHGALLRRHLRFGASAAVEVSSAVLGTIVTIVLALRGFGPWALVAGHGANELAHVILLWLVVRWRPTRPARGANIGEMVALGRDLTLFNVFTYWSRNLDNLLIGKFWGAAQLGLYSRAYQLLLLPLQQVTSPLAPVSIAALSRLNGQESRYRQAYVRILEKVTIACMPMTIFLFVESHRVVQVVLGTRWLDVAPIFRPLAVAGFIQPVSATLIWLLVSQGRRQDLRRWSIIGPTLTCLSIVIGLPWGPVAVAMVYAVGEILVRTPLLIWFVSRSGPIGVADIISASRPGLFASAAVFVACSAVSRIIPGEGAIGLGISLLTAGAAAAGTLFALPSGRRACADILSVLPVADKDEDAEAVLF